MQNQPELETVSVRLYKYLCDEVVGSENIVRYRRLYYKLNDDMLDSLNYELISSGSKAEGLDLPGSDFDIMFLFKSLEVYEEKPKDKEDVLLLETQNTLPGFALLKISDSLSFLWSPTITADGNLLSNSVFNMVILSKIGQPYANFYELHGPCISISFLFEIDIMACLMCHTWPKIAKQWLLRYRPFGWPSQDIITKIVYQGCLLVPVGSKSFDSEGNPLEWRLSFSLSEKLLVHSFNHTQLLCYALLKIWLKEILNTDNKLKNKLCSYYMKTVLFWILEESENLNWNPQNLFRCFNVCIQRLHYWVICGYFPNYFIPENNMIDGKLSKEDLTNISLFLDNFNIRENWKKIFSAPSLCNLSQHQIHIQRQHYRLSELDEAVLSTQPFGSLMFEMFNVPKHFKVHSINECVMYRMVNKHLPKSARKILTLMFLKTNKNVLASLNTVNHSNKQWYIIYKECLSRMLMNTFVNAESGWLLLSAFFYSTQKYHEMSRVLQMSSNIVSLTSRFEQIDVNLQSFRDISKLKKMVYSKSFLKRMRYEISRVFDVDLKCFRTDTYPFLTEEIPRIGCVGGLPSHNLLFFLQFLNGRKQNSLETKTVLQKLNTIYEEEIKKSKHILCTFSSCTLLLKVFELTNDVEGYRTCALRFLKAMRNSAQFETIKNYFQKEEMVLFLLLLEMVTLMKS